jgi:hypothetical protein
VFAHSWKHGETLVGNNVSATMFPSLPMALEPLKNFAIEEKKLEIFSLPRHLSPLYPARH